MTSPLEDLRLHLQAAVELELLVIPPYLCALYSIHPGSNEEATLIIRSVVVEEMLHMILAGNVLTAVGGRPTVTDPLWVPRYPAAIPYHAKNFQVGLLPFGDQALEVFLAIENPSYDVASPPSRAADAAIPRATQLVWEREYRTIGEFYAAIETALTTLNDELGPRELFSGADREQIGPGHYYGSAGTAIVVHDLATARAALREIVEQGEGEVTQPPAGEKFDEDADLAHYYRFNELRRRRRYRPSDAPNKPLGPPIAVDLEAVYPVRPNLRLEDLPTEELRAAAAAFNDVYARLLHQIQRAFDGYPDELTAAVGTMFTLKYAAIDLMRIPLADGSGLNAGPTFEYSATT